MARKIGNWQAELDDLLKCSRDSGHLKSFGATKTNEDRSRFVFDQKLFANIGWLREYFGELCQTFQRKNAERAAHHKQEGNKLFVAKQDEQALLSYTRSMQFAPSRMDQAEDDDLHLGVAYGNRSAVLFRMHRYQECVKDIQRALAAGIPKQSQAKVLVRQCLCYAKLGQKEKAVAAHQAILSLGESCDDKTKRYLEGEMGKIKTQIENIPDSSGDHGSPSKEQHSQEPAVSYGLNKVLVQASSAVEMKVTPAQGRFLQATRDIKAGDTLIVERPFAAVLLPPHYDNHCLHCFGALPHNPLGCRVCSGVLYCSEECRDDSWMSYHHVECRYMDLLHSVGIAHLSLRIVLTVGLPGLQDFLSKRKERGGVSPDVIPGVTEEGRYERNYLSVYDLMTHADDMTVDDLFQYSLTANLLLAILVHAGWLINPQPPAPDTNRDVRTRDLFAFLDGEYPFQNSTPESGLHMERVFSVGGVLLRHVQQLVCNAHAITAVCSGPISRDHSSRVEGRSQERVATAIYPTASLMNHSCDPTIISSFQKNILIVKSVKDVPRGGEIFNCYGPHCQRMKRGERQEVLKTQYFFHCVCPPCSDGSSGDQSLAGQGVQCSSCRGTVVIEQEGGGVTCPGCHTTVDMAAILSRLQVADTLFMEGTRLIEQEDFSRAVKKLEGCLEIRRSVLSSNHHDLGQVHDAIAQCLASAGRYAEAADHLTASVAITEAIFGCHSVETARELHKMAEVLIQAGRPKDALATASRALDIASRLYSEGDDWVKELLCLKTALTGIISDGHCL